MLFLPSLNTTLRMGSGCITGSGIYGQHRLNRSQTPFITDSIFFANLCFFKRESFGVEDVVCTCGVDSLEKLSEETEELPLSVAENFHCWSRLSVASGEVDCLTGGLLIVMQVAWWLTWSDTIEAGYEDDCLTAEILLAQRVERENRPPAATRAHLPAPVK